MEYADIHNYDSSTVTPEWHGWVHHMSDTAPGQTPLNVQRIGKTASVDHCPYDTHVGPEALDPMMNQCLTGFRPRGYGFGNLYQKWGEPELYYKQVRVSAMLYIYQLSLSHILTLTLLLSVPFMCAYLMYMPHTAWISSEPYQ